MALKVCRICGDNKELKNILEQGPEMIEKLIKCANIQIYIEDQLPKLICEQCDANLDLSYRLRKQSDETQKRLRRELKMKETHEDGKQETILQNHEEVACDIIYKEEEQLKDVDIASCFQSVPLEIYDIDISDEEEFETIDNNTEPRTLSSEILVEDKSSESFKECGSQEDSMLSIIEAQPHFEAERCVNDINPIITEQIKNSTGPLLPSLTEKIFIDDDDDDDNCEDNTYEKYTINDASQNKTVEEQFSINLVTSSDCTSDECEEMYTVMQSVYDNYSSYTCPTCQEQFSTKAEYGEHIKQHGTQRFQCIQCPKFFPTRFRLGRHEETHIEVPLQKCGYCQRSFRATYNLERHVLSVHTSSKKFICEICNKRFSRSDVLKRHMQLHSDEKEFACTMCSQSFQTKDYLYSHRKKHHNPESSESLKGTTETRSKRKEKTDKHQCGNCGKLFKTSFSYKRHLLIHTNEKPHECETCKKRFRTIAALMAHERVHTDYRPYQCDICFKSFKQISHLKDHKMLHLDAAPHHICPICDATFLQKGNLNTHMRRHTKDKPFKCAACSSEFAFMHLLKRHANLVHGRTVDDSLSSIDITEETTESEQYDYIDSVTANDVQEDDDVVEVIEDNLLSEKVVNENSAVAIDKPVSTHMHTDTSNGINSLATSDFIEDITEEEIQITEENVKVFVSEETKFTNFYNTGPEDINKPN